MDNPYSKLPRHSFWRNGVAEGSPFDPQGIYARKWELPVEGKIATAGSCFAQHIARHLRSNGYQVLDAEPPPIGLEPEKHLEFGYSMYSARFGNIYTVHQLLQLAREALGEFQPAEPAWERDGRFYDSQRPAIEPNGFESVEELLDHRQYHLKKVRLMLESMAVFVFTLGLTEAWVHKESGTVFPVAPGTAAGSFSPDRHAFKNFSYLEIVQAFDAFEALLRRVRGELPKMILTVSPVPLVATATGAHVLPATAYSKATLRAVAGDIAASRSNVDYFPSFEIVTNPSARSVFYEPNLRSVQSTGVEVVMRTFFEQHRPRSG